MWDAAPRSTHCGRRTCVTKSYEFENPQWEPPQALLGKKVSGPVMVGEVNEIAARIRDNVIDRRRAMEPNVVLRHDAGQTEIDAAGSELPRSGTHRRKIYDAIAMAWPDGLTEEEMVSSTELHPNTIRPRRSELMHERRIAQSEQVRRNERGNDEFVWVLTDLGVAEHGLAPVGGGEDGGVSTTMSEDQDGEA